LSDAEMATVPPTPDRRLKTYRLSLAVLWTLTILALCWLPGDFVRDVEEESSLFEIPNLDKVIHWGIFLLFTTLWLRVGSSRWRFVWVGLAGLLLAILSELGQMLPIVGRDGNLADGVTDCIGVLLGIVLAPALEPPMRWLESRILRKPSS
jgi:VanZ family protein